MAFTEQQKVDLRRHCGYAVYGKENVQTLGWRYFLRTGQFEFIIQELTPQEETTVIDDYLTKCNTLYDDIYQVRTNSDTSQAAVWYRNSKELAERKENYYWHCEMLCKFLMANSYGPSLNGGGINIVV